jgi:1-deoxy-D-xylulose-5-phosphate reductoisomerase
MARNLLLLGSTGSIGRQTLDVVRQMSERVRIFGLAGRSNVALLRAQAAEFNPVAVVTGSDGREALHGSAPEVLTDSDGMVELCRRPEVDLVVVATAGEAGLLPTLAALESGKHVALANKETLVSAGPLIKAALRKGGGRLVPIDSEHSAIWQCVQGESDVSIERLTLTASGGALRDRSNDELHCVTPEQALSHPTWPMGRKITIDSANLMNKGLEVLEATWLFDLPMDSVEIVLHPQSIVHSLVTFSDSSTKAQLGLPNMRLPIQYALSHPDRWPNDLERLDLVRVGSLDFAPVDLARYPALALALRAGREGGTYPAVLCAADEIAVEAFLSRTISFTRIPAVVEAVLDAHDNCPSPGLDDIIEVSRWARWTAHRLTAG